MAGYIGSKSSVTLVDGITEEGGTLTGDLSFGDNDKAIFGAGSDLQIYSDGTHSRIHESGSGLLIVRASNFNVNNADGSDSYITMQDGGAVTAYYDGSAKLATTSTGVDVTGSASTDGITITNPLSGSFYNAKLEFTRDGTSGGSKIQSERNSAGGVGMSFNYTANNTAEVNGTYTKAVTIDSSGNVGIGTDSPSASLHISKNVDGNATELLIENQFVSASSTDESCRIQSRFGGYDASYIITGKEEDWTTASNRSSYMSFTTRKDNTLAERMRIDSSGNLIVGSDTAGGTTSGGKFYATPSEGMYVASNNDPAGYFNRNSSDGTIVEIRRNNSIVGSIFSGHGNTQVGIGTNTTGITFNPSTRSVMPANPSSTSPQLDATLDLGFSSVRWDDIYAVNGTIQTSDATEKQDIATLTATEILVGKRLSGLFKTFRWKDSVASNPNARTHTGTIAQDVQAAFTAEGLDAGDYALFISTTWWETQTEVPAVEAVAEVTDEDGNVTTEAVGAVDAYTRTDTYNTEAEAPEGATERTRMGIRYPELLSFVAAYNEQRFASIEARLTALEDV